MNIIEYFKNKSKNNNISLVKASTQVSNTVKKKKPKNIVEFIKYGIITNGGNYDDIYYKLTTISEFAKNASEYGVNCNLNNINDILNYFFTQQKHIKFFPLKNQPHTAFYTDAKDSNAYYNYRGVTVMQDDNLKRPIMYYGRRHKKAESHARDTLLFLGDNEIVLRSEMLANYDEIPLYGDGTYAEFYFDKNNKINKVIFRTMSHPRLKMWGKEQVCELDYETNEYKLLSLKKLPPKYNEPVITEKSRKNLTQTLLK